MRIYDSAKAVEAMGGLASRRELVALGCWEQSIDLAANYGRILRVRRGWYASLGTDEDVLLAWRIGGRLACISALAYYGLAESRGGADALHVLVRRGDSRLRVPKRRGVVLHWTRLALRGTRLAVAPEVATAQAATCAPQWARMSDFSNAQRSRLPVPVPGHEL